MNHRISLISLAAIALALALPAAAQKPAAPPAPAAAPAAAPAPAGGVIAGGLVGDVTQWKGVVMAVNQTSRHVVVKGPNGTMHAFTAQKGGVDISQVKKGDTVTVDYVESIAVFLREATDPPVTASANVVTVAPKGLPAVTDVTVKELEANVTAIDAKDRVLTVKTSQGNTVTFHVDPSVTAFSKVKVGDQIVIRATEALALKVTR
jgi:glucose/arabinose dehydrogenase